MAMAAWVNTTPVGLKTKLRRWRSSTDGAGEDCGAAIAIPTLTPGEAELLGILAFRGMASGAITIGGTQGFRIAAGHSAAAINMRMLGANGYEDRLSADSMDNSVPGPLAYAAMGANGTMGILNHVLAWDRASVVYTEGTNTGGLLQWVELWYFPCLPGAGNPYSL